MLWINQYGLEEGFGFPVWDWQEYPRDNYKIRYAGITPDLILFPDLHTCEN